MSQTYKYILKTFFFHLWIAYWILMRLWLSTTIKTPLPYPGHNHLFQDFFYSDSFSVPVCSIHHFALFCVDRLSALLFHYTAIAYLYSSIIKYLGKKQGGMMMDVTEHEGVMEGWAHQPGASTSGSALARSCGRARARGEVEALQFGRNAVIIQMRSLQPNRVLETA